MNTLKFSIILVVINFAMFCVQGADRFLDCIKANGGKGCSMTVEAVVKTDYPCKSVYSAIFMTLLMHQALKDADANEGDFELKFSEALEKIASQSQQDFDDTFITSQEIQRAAVNVLKWYRRIFEMDLDSLYLNGSMEMTNAVNLMVVGGALATSNPKVSNDGDNLLAVDQDAMELLVDGVKAEKSLLTRSQLAKWNKQTVIESMMLTAAVLFEDQLAKLGSLIKVSDNSGQ